MKQFATPHRTTWRLAVLGALLIIAFGIPVCAQEGDDTQDAYEEGYQDGYAAAVQQAYEAELRALYAEREALAQSQATQAQINQADAAMVEAMLAVQADYRAMYFDALSDLQDQNAEYWAALEAAISETSCEEPDAIYTFYGVPAYCAPYAGYYSSSGSYIYPTSGNWVYPTHASTNVNVEVDDIVTNVQVYEHSQDMDQLMAHNEQWRTEQMNRLHAEEGRPGTSPHRGMIQSESGDAAPRDFQRRDGDAPRRGPTDGDGPQVPSMGDHPIGTRDLGQAPTVPTGDRPSFDRSSPDRPSPSVQPGQHQPQRSAPSGGSRRR